MSFQFKCVLQTFHRRRPLGSSDQPVSCFSRRPSGNRRPHFYEPRTISRQQPQTITSCQILPTTRKWCRCRPRRHSRPRRRTPHPRRSRPHLRPPLQVSSGWATNQHLKPSVYAQCIWKYSYSSLVLAWICKFVPLFSITNKNINISYKIWWCTLPMKRSGNTES